VKQRDVVWHLKLAAGPMSFGAIIDQQGVGARRDLPTGNVPASTAEDIVTDFQAGNGGDVIRLASSNPNPFESGRLRVGQSSDDTVILLRDDQGVDHSVLRLIGVTATNLTAENFDGIPFGIDNSININDTDAGDTLVGGPLDDRIFGNGGADTISGFAGNDRLAGGADPDLIYGGFGNDRLAGQEGNDILCGGAGDDILSGGSGDPVWRR
jgi:Ca2+-binding RTX toxin-like protein